MAYYILQIFQPKFSFSTLFLGERTEEVVIIRTSLLI